jgi:hypothetical protein
MSKPACRWLLVAAAFVLPWVIVIGMHVGIAEWWPGRIRSDSLRNLSSLSFLLGGVGAAVLLLRSSQSIYLRALAALVRLQAASAWRSSSSCARTAAMNRFMSARPSKTRRNAAKACAVQPRAARTLAPRASATSMPSTPADMMPPA